jgi:DNA-binding CsgD family transcriptional regulator
MNLTPREHDVLAGIADGLSDQQIGDRLHISHHTVNRHGDVLRARLGVRTRAHAVAIAYQHGLLTAPTEVPA